MLSLRQALQELGKSSIREAVESTGVKDPSVRRQIPRALSKQAILRFHAETLGVLIVGSPVGTILDAANGAHEQRFEFGSILKPLGNPPVVAARYVATIDIAAIRCFGTEDPSGGDEPYLVAAVYGIDPFVKERAIQTNEIHFTTDDTESIREGAVFALGHQLTPAPIFIPGDGNIQVNISLWDEEVAQPSALRDKWTGTVTAAILAGLTLLNPVVGGGAAALETAKGVVSDASRQLINVVGEFVGIADDHIATHEFPITADFLKRLIAHGEGMPRTSPSIPGIKYNFPELPETQDQAGHSWLFEGGGGSYRIFLSVRAAEVTFSPSP
jgi:hypothetical protein